MPVTYISAGSTTRVKDGPGLLKGVWISPVAGGTLLIADNPDMGATPNFNNLTAITSTIANVGTWAASPQPQYLDGFATRFANALVIATTSSPRVSVFWE